MKNRTNTCVRAKMNLSIRVAQDKDWDRLKTANIGSLTDNKLFERL